MIRSSLSGGGFWAWPVVCQAGEDSGGSWSRFVPLFGGVIGLYEIIRHDLASMCVLFDGAVGVLKYDEC